MREKLIELLEGIDGESGFRLLGYHDVRRIADHLIANYVVVLPIPEGSSVYALYDRNMRRNGKSRHNHQITSNDCLKLTIRRGGNIEIRKKRAAKQDIILLGYFTFPSMEDAECKLKEMLKTMAGNKTEV